MYKLYMYNLYICAVLIIYIFTYICAVLIVYKLCV